MHPRFSTTLTIRYLLPLVREHVYHSEFRGSFSIKKVLPALVPDLSYDGLTISEGSAASVAYVEMTDPDTSKDRRDTLRKGLLEYCKLDTEAMVALYERLR